MRRRFIKNILKIVYIKNNEIWYTNGSNITPTPLYSTDSFNANIISTVYSAKIKSWVITFDNDITTIGSYAFYNCSSLTSVNIPDSVTSIGNRAFSNCSSLTSVYCKAATPPALGGSSLFLNNGSGRKIYVPYQSLDAYKTATNWSNYAADIVGYDFENDTVVG